MAYIKLNKHNFFHNLNQLVLKAGSKERLSVVLKDNAYGHGLEIMASLASEFGIRQAVVISDNEAERIKEYFDRILILNGTPHQDDKFTYAITEISQLEMVDPNTAIELKVDTGMHRNGITVSQMDQAIGIIKSHKLKLVGVMTHYRSADVLSSELFWQQKNFEKVKQAIIESGLKVRFHSHNSATLLRSNRFNEDMARAGIAIYGYNELPSVYDDVNLKPVLSLYAERASTRILRRGERVGYGGTFIAPSDMTVSTYDIGYGDGWIRGDHMSPYYTAEKLPLLGRVSMDFVSVESEKETICIMDNAKQAARHFGTISYEMTTMLSPSLNRIVEG